MAGEAATQLIFFIGAVVMATGVVMVVSTNVHSITASYGMNSKTLADQLQTDITIINDPAMIPCDGTGSTNNCSFYVKNTGKNNLNPAAVNMFVNGTYVNLTNRFAFDRCTIMDTNTSCSSNSSWQPTQVLRLNASVSLFPPVGSGISCCSVRVVAGNGVFDTMLFTR